MSKPPSFSDLVGKTVLIGITRLDHKESLVDQSQFVGKVKSMDDVIHITLRNGEDYTLPPELRAFEEAPPGVYRLRSTGEEIVNPDYTTSWTVRAPAAKRARKPKRKLT